MAERGVVGRSLVGCHGMGCIFILASCSIFTNGLEEGMNNALITTRAFTYIYIVELRWLPLKIGT